MSIEQPVEEGARIHVENVGGIEETDLAFSPGVTILAGRNATNRTSFLQAIMTVCGSDNVSVKGDADEAYVELTLGDETYTRSLSRHNGVVSGDGDPLLDDSMLADLFAFLLESNEARRAVALSEDLRELIMRPVDTDEIQAEIDRLVAERKSLESELDEIDSLKGNLPKLETERGNLQDQIEEKKVELEAKEEELEAIDADVEESRDEKAELEDRLSDLRSKRSALDDVRYDLETEQESLDALTGEQNELEAEDADLPEAPVGEIKEIESEVERLRSRKQTIETEINKLQSTIRFNEEMLEGSNREVLQVLSAKRADESGSVTDKLLEDDATTCWTCGSTVETDQIQTTVDQLKEINREKISSVNEIQDDLDELKTERRDLEKKQQQREQVERRLADIESEIEAREENIETLRDRRTELTEEIEAIEAEVEDLEDDSYSEILDVHKAANQLEYELGKLENDLERVEDEIESLESRIAERDAVEAERDEVQAEIEELRTKIERIEDEAIEGFNEHMDTVLELLDYANIERIWLERVEREVREGRRKVSKSIFELHVIRSTASGATYEDTVDHLSESEREVTGLVFALAGYLAHDVHESVPFMLLDSLEAIDSERIATLLEYLADYSSYLVVALLPEDAAALSDEYQRVTTI
ncbi:MULTISPECIES: archaea-specific SMC-related protein [unclassified Haladaptatus]|uniref:archaea-specific SMC-related protein n=1 Tax=unclassified Haladaptatus TaxID=2622732 RepID=UPI0023E8B833|nr:MULTISPECIES: archaea-specific SMC-related protein [unclassified Haladaptatus]